MIYLIRNSFESIFANKTRSILTMLGIIVGVTSMMLISVIGRAFSDTFEVVTEKLYKTDKMTVDIVPSEKNHTYVSTARGDIEIPEDVYLDVRKVEEMLEKKEYGSAYVSTGNFVTDDARAVLNGRSQNVFIWANCAGESTSATGLMIKGREISVTDINECAATALISDVTERALFGEGGDALGNTILVQSGNTVIPVVVVGVYIDCVYEIYNASYMFINSSYMVENYQNIFNDYYWERNRLVISMEGITDKEEFKRNAVADLNRILNNDQWQVKAVTETEALDSTKMLVDIILMIVFIIACISLIVGSLGIMSIMLITVSERTNEIGIRKSIGASNLNIMVQFLCESLTLSMLGTFIGILLGMIFSKIVTIKASEILSQMFQMPITVEVALPIGMIGVSLLSAFVIGIVFGLYPAVRASKMEIVDALRFE